MFQHCLMITIILKILTYPLIILGDTIIDPSQLIIIRIKRLMAGYNRICPSRFVIRYLIQLQRISYIYPAISRDVCRDFFVSSSC